ncbi:hypothetical protein [Uliginosibacterium sp. TH139]|uniref:hypothetical protein n=1 Tax=Uliginosibacterium sp. TH139 TaxID=2067453 RepID=UPI00117E9E72|nr:hypothetical protein [Uliginosibacterium sp. TH139]
MKREDLFWFWVVLAAPGAIISLRFRKQLFGCLVCSPVVSLIGAAVVFNCIQKADASTIGFTPVSAFLIQAPVALALYLASRLVEKYNA